MKELTNSQMQEINGGWVIYALVAWFLVETLNNPSESVNALVEGFKFARNL